MSLTTTNAHPLGASAVVSNADWALMDPGLAILAQDANGDDTYNNEKAMIGHLEAKLNFLIDDATSKLLIAAPAIAVDLKSLGKKHGISDYLLGGSKQATHNAASPYLAISSSSDAEKKLVTTRITALNFAQLREAGMDSKSAFLSAALRARWAITGAYAVAMADTSASYTEMATVAPGDLTYGRIADAKTSREVFNSLGKYAQEFMVAYQDESCGMKWVTKHAENIWASVEHCFRVRSHHFKDSREMIDSFSSLYTRYLEAAYEGEFDWPDDVPMIDVFRTAIHPFKLKALPIMTAHYASHGKIANAAITRMSGSPCGMAQITTSVAALDTMRAEVWWSAFSQAYGEDIDMAVSFANQINDDKYSYHISAGLYGVTKAMELTHGGKTYSVDEAKSHVQLIASACQGLISALREAVVQKLITKFALQNARALEKPASANPLLSLRITHLVSSALNAITQSDNMTDAIQNALPDMVKGVKASASVPGA